MADNLTLQTAAPATPSASIKPATREITYSGETAHAPAGGIVIFAGADDAKTAADLVGGAGAVSAGTPRVTLASDDPAVAAVGAKADAAATTDAGTFSLIALFKRLLEKLTTGIGITGSVEVTNDSGNPLPVSGTVAVSGNVEVVNDSGNPLPISGTVTEASAAAIAAFASVLDDWDESDRAKVNPIAGQAGVAAGAGAVDALTQRTTLASDDPAVTALQIMDDWDNGASDGASISGDVAHDTADAGEPVKIGGTAVAPAATPASVAAGDRVRRIHTTSGLAYGIGGHPGAVTVGIKVADADGAQADVSVAGTIAAGSYVVVTRVTVTVDEACTAGIALAIGFGTANVPTSDTDGVVGMLYQHHGLVPGSHISIGDGSGIIGVGASGEELRYTCEDPVGGSIGIQITYYIETPA